METPKNKKEWFVFVVKYASAIILLLGALWNYGEIAYNKITGTNSAIRLEKERQIELWHRNISCLKTSPQIFETDKREIIEMLLCEKTGDLLVKVIFPHDRSLNITKWIELTKSESSSSIFGLYAEIRRVKKGSVVVELCRELIDGNLIIVRKINNTCVKEINNIRTGISISVDIPCKGVCNE